MSDLNTTIKEVFPNKRVIIIGDLVADQFLNGTISRVSREAPVFILKHDETTTLPGAAANAAANVAALGARPVLIGFTGTDAIGETLIKTLEAAGVECAALVAGPELSTTTKVRVLAGQHYAPRQQVIRIDYEMAAEVPAALMETLRSNLADAADAADAIIISDYGYGAVFPEIVADAMAIAADRRVPLIVDSRHGLEKLTGATTATPNREEVEQILGTGFTANDCARLRQRQGYEALLITNGNQGMLLFEKDAAPLQIDAVGSTEPVDVTGAGDTVIAAYALGLASGMTFAEAARIANHAGGIVVMKKGTACVTAAELLASLAGDAARPASHQAK